MKFQEIVKIVLIWSKITKIQDLRLKKVQKYSKILLIHFPVTQSAVGSNPT